MKEKIFERVEKALFSKRLKYILLNQMKKSGIELSLFDLFTKLYIISYILTMITVAYAGFKIFESQNYGLINFIITMLSLIILSFAVSFFLLLLGFLFYMNIRIYNRTKEIEKVLPDFLQLTSANIRAGMSIDKALWFSIRPRFGILAKEIEIVAKKSMTGEDLEKALLDFAAKYDSPLLERTVNLLIEGLDAGGEIGNLLNRIASNIQENQLTKKEMAENVTTYIIFITFATIVAAPLLFALSFELLIVVKTLSTDLNFDEVSTSVAIPIKFSTKGIELEDFKLFIFVNLLITSIFSALLVATIAKGDVKPGVKSIPIFAVLTISLFFVFSKVLHSLLSIFFM